MEKLIKCLWFLDLNSWNPFAVIARLRRINRLVLKKISSFWFFYSDGWDFYVKTLLLIYFKFVGEPKLSRIGLDGDYMANRIGWIDFFSNFIGV